MMSLIFSLSCNRSLVLGDSNLHAGVSGASSLGHITIEVVLDHDHFLAAVGVGFEDALNRRVCTLALSTCDVPPIETNSVSKSLMIKALVVPKLLSASKTSSSSVFCTYAFLIMSSK